MKKCRQRVTNVGFVVKGRTALVDLDSLVYKVGFKAQKDDYIVNEDGFTPTRFNTLTQARNHAAKIGVSDDDITKETVIQDAASVKSLIRKTIHSWVRKSKSEYFALYLHGGGNFREDLVSKVEYKANRVNMSKPALFDKIKVYIIKEYRVNLVKGIETDDMVCIEHWNSFKLSGGVKSKAKTVLVSIDKDLMQIPGWYLNPDKFDEPRWIPEEGFLKLVRDTETVLKKKKKAAKIVGGGEIWFYAQMLLGDTADNIKGIKGYGPVKVYDELLPLLGDKKALELYVWEAYKKVYTEDAMTWFVDTGIMLWMLRDLEGSVNHWRPSYVTMEDGSWC